MYGVCVVVTCCRYSFRFALMSGGLWVQLHRRIDFGWIFGFAQLGISCLLIYDKYIYLILLGIFNTVCSKYHILCEIKP